MNVHRFGRMSGGSAYLWMAARARNALRRVVVFGIVGGVVFIAALIAFVVVPRNASRKALAVAAQLDAKTDSSPLVAARNRYLAEVTATDSALNAARRAATPVPIPVIDTFPPAVRARLENATPEERQQIMQRLQQQAKRGLNENYARELMELHTLGVDGGYTQKDVG